MTTLIANATQANAAIAKVDKKRILERISHALDKADEFQITVHSRHEDVYSLNQFESLEGEIEETSVRFIKHDNADGEVPTTPDLFAKVKEMGKLQCFSAQCEGYSVMFGRGDEETNSLEIFNGIDINE